MTPLSVPGKADAPYRRCQTTFFWDLYKPAAAESAQTRAAAPFICCRRFDESSVFSEGSCIIRTKSTDVKPSGREDFRQYCTRILREPRKTAWIFLPFYRSFCHGGFEYLFCFFSQNPIGLFLFSCVLFAFSAFLKSNFHDYSIFGKTDHTFSLRFKICASIQKLRLCNLFPNVKNGLFLEFFRCFCVYYGIFCDYLFIFKYIYSFFRFFQFRF